MFSSTLKYEIGGCIGRRVRAHLSHGRRRRCGNVDGRRSQRRLQVRREGDGHAVRLIRVIRVIRVLDQCAVGSGQGRRQEGVYGGLAGGVAVGMKGRVVDDDGGARGPADEVGAVRGCEPF